jgi:rRNA maturation endonuclease Nob1
LKVKILDVQRAVEIIRRNYIKSTGLNSEDFPGNDTVFSLEAETVVCPACSMRFKPALRICPDCGLQLG